MPKRLHPRSLLLPTPSPPVPVACRNPIAQAYMAHWSMLEYAFDVPGTTVSLLTNDEPWGQAELAAMDGDIEDERWPDGVLVKGGDYRFDRTTMENFFCFPSVAFRYGDGQLTASGEVRGIDFENMAFLDVDFTDTVFSGCNFADAVFANCVFGPGTVFSCCGFMGVKFLRCFAPECVNFYECEQHGVVYRECLKNDVEKIIGDIVDEAARLADIEIG